jgi:hypothetical protein
MLSTIRGIESKVVDVRDNNRIDKEVTEYKPTHVIIEALWVIPEKFKVLCKLHPKVKWFLRLHSDFPFIASEGIAIDWLFKYKKYGLKFIANCPDMAKELEKLLGERVAYLPNYYPLKNWWEEYHYEQTSKLHPRARTISIGCFGAIRPLKNQLSQAIAAIRFADERRVKLKYYINTGRLESGGAPILKNIRALFANSPHHELVEVSWLDHKDFTSLLIDEIDLGLQVSFSETFNIVSADMVASQVPIVVSKEVYWASPKCMVEPYVVGDIVSKMGYVLDNARMIVSENKSYLAAEDEMSKRAWKEYLCAGGR